MHIKSQVVFHFQFCFHILSIRIAWLIRDVKFLTWLYGLFAAFFGRLSLW